MKKKGIIILLVTLFIIALTGNAFAWAGRAGVEGRPEQFNSEHRSGYYIWHDEQGFHVWSETMKREHVFTGNIRTDGDIYDLRGHNLEQGDGYKEIERESNWPWFLRRSEGEQGRRYSENGRELNYARDRVNFKFNTAGGSDGINFKIKDARYVEFELLIDGEPIPRNKIFISEVGWHPELNHFKLYP